MVVFLVAIILYRAIMAVLVSRSPNTVLAAWVSPGTEPPRPIPALTPGPALFSNPAPDSDSSLCPCSLALA